MTTLTALARTGIAFQLSPRRRGFLLGFFATLAAGIMLLSAASIAVGVLSAGKIMPGVRVAGVEVGGMDRATAAAHLRAELPPLTAGEVALDVDGTTVALPFDELGRGYQVDAMLDTAFAVARSGDLAADAIGRLRILAQPVSVAAVATGDDPAALDRAVASLVAQFTVAPVDAAVSYDPAAGFAVVPATEGASLDADALRTALAAVLARPTSGPHSIAISSAAIEPAVTTGEARRAATMARRMTEAPLALRVAEDRFPIEPAALAALVSFAADADGALVPSLDEAALAALIEPLAGEVAREPRNASFEWGPAGITGVVPAADGLELDVAASVSNVVDVLQRRARAAVLRSAPLALAVSAPALTTEAATAAAAEMRRLSTWTTYYQPGEGNYWNANIHIPAWDLDKFVLAPGEWFSFWNDIGPVTLERGYGYGGVIIGGRSVRNGAIAGGICSTSTTLFNAAMRSGLEIGDRANHSYYIERYPVGLDATVLKTDTWAQDMTFRNDTANPLVIRSYTGNGWVRFDIWGVPDGRTVRLSAPTTSNHKAAVETTVVNASLAPGTSRRVEYPHNGFYAVVSRWVYDADGDVLHEDVWTSSYRTVNGITEVGPAPAPTEPPDEPDPTEPPPDA